MNLLNIFRKSDDAEKSDKPAPDGVHNIPASEAESAPKSDGPIDPEAVKENIVTALKTVYDPEIPIDIFELGLIYDIQVQEDGQTHITMTLTAPNCPAAGILPGQVESAARGVPGVYDVHLDLVFDPPWDMERISEAGRLELGML